jgi:hypothetical protein
MHIRPSTEVTITRMIRRYTSLKDVVIFDHLYNDSYALFTVAARREPGGD